MALGTMGVLDKDGNPVTINKIASGRQAAADSQAVVLSAEDLAALQALSDAVTGVGVTVTASFSRPANTTAYAVNDAISDSTSAPTSGGFAVTSAARQSGGSGTILDVLAISTNDPATPVQLELWIFDSAATNINDNAAFSLSDGDAVKLVAVVPLSFGSTMNSSGNNSWAYALVNQGFTCSGSADLRFLVKVKTAYTPASGETFTFRFKLQRST